MTRQLESDTRPGPGQHTTLRRAGDVALWATAVLGLVSILMVAAGAIFGLQPLIFRSGSMAPAIQTGALAVAVPVAAADVEVGDVVSVAGAKGTRVTHRVVEVTAGSGEAVTLTLQGDANDQPDADPYVVSTVDRVVLDVPYLGYVAAWLAGPVGMFVAGVVVAAVLLLVLRRPGVARRAGATGTVALGVVLVATGVSPVASTDAYFTDSPRFSAGTISAHQVSVFDWSAAPPCVVNPDGRGITVSHNHKNPRYSVVWDRVGPGGTSRVKTVVPAVGPGQRVDTPFTFAELTGGVTTPGSRQLSGASKLRGSGTTEWLSSARRAVPYTVTNETPQKVVCGQVNLGPGVIAVAPTDGKSYSRWQDAAADVAAACSAAPNQDVAGPCGTVSDPDGNQITSVQYKLRRIHWTGTNCWNDTRFAACGQDDWRPALTDKSLPAAGPVAWEVPDRSAIASIFGPWLLDWVSSGEFVLQIRVVDNGSPAAVTERTFTFFIT